METIRQIEQELIALCNDYINDRKAGNDKKADEIYRTIKRKEMFLNNDGYKVEFDDDGNPFIV